MPAISCYVRSSNNCKSSMGWLTVPGGQCFGPPSAACSLRRILSRTGSIKTKTSPVKLLLTQNISNNNIMKKLFSLLAFCLSLSASYAQSLIKDDAVDNQSQRMVFQQWDQNNFYPKAGFLSLNPYYWLVWGLFDPNYHKTDLRPLSPTGPQTQRLALVGSMNSIDGNYKLNSDTARNTALSQIASQSGLLSDADPLWLLYYSQQFQPLLNYSAASILGPLSPTVSAKLVSEGMYSWYTNELDRLKQRLNGARTTDMDR